MAARARQFQILIVVATFLSISTNVNSVNSLPCAAFDCGNGLTLSYPFHPQIHHPTFCGYPNLAISCTNNQPILQISNNPYAVESLNISGSSITVAHGGDAAESCPIAVRAVALGQSEYSLLSYNNAGNKMIRFYYNCTVYPPSAAGIKCLQRGAKHSYAFLEGSEPESESDWIRYCESNVTVPVIESAVDDLRNGSGNAVKLGFTLTWKSIDRSCKLCEESGGFCGYSSSGGVDRNFFCFCSDGRNTSLTCHVSAGEVSKTSQLNYVAIGSVIFGGVAILFTVVFFNKKMKFGVQKYGFNRLPTTSGK